MPFLIRISRIIFFHLNKNVKNACMKLSTYSKCVFFFYTIFTSSHMKQNHRRKYYILQYSFTCPHTDGQISKFAFKCSNFIRNIEACKSYLISKMSPACIFIFALMKLLLVVWFNFLSLGIVCRNLFNFCVIIRNNYLRSYLFNYLYCEFDWVSFCF